MTSKLVKLLNLALCFSQIIHANEGKVQNLSGRANFHSILLRWERHSPVSSSTDLHTNSDDLDENTDYQTTFLVKVCENQHWGTDNCREIVTNENNLIKTEDDGVGGYEAYSFNLKGLRMATSYTISVVSTSENEIGGSGGTPAIHSTLARHGDGRTQRQFDTTITKDTKGFSAKATACNITATQIHLETGPHFGGRISLEGIDPNSQKPRMGNRSNSSKEAGSTGDENEDNKIKEDCSFYGDPKSTKPFVIFDIDHEKCQGVHVNGTSMRAYVVVQESLSILTHSTRKFMVVCSFKPSTFTIQTGLSMPAPAEISRIKDVLSFRSNRLPTTTTIKTPFQGPKLSLSTTTKTNENEPVTTPFHSDSPTELSSATAFSFTTKTHIGKADMGSSDKARIDLIHNPTEATEKTNKSEDDSFVNILNQENWPEDENEGFKTPAFPSLVSEEYTIPTKRPPFYFQPYPQKLGPKELPRSVMNPVAISFSGSGSDWSRGQDPSTHEDYSDKGQESDYEGEAMPRAFGSTVRRRRKLITTVTPDEAEALQTSTHIPVRDRVSSGQFDDGSPSLLSEESEKRTPPWTSVRSGSAVQSKFLSFSPSHTLNKNSDEPNSSERSHDGNENEGHARSNEILDRYPPTFTNEERTKKSEEANEPVTEKAMETSSSPQENQDQSLGNGDELIIMEEHQGAQESSSKEPLFTDEWLPGGSNHFPIFLQDPSNNQVDVHKKPDQSTLEIHDRSSLFPDDSIPFKSSYDRDITFQKPDDHKLARQQKARKGFPNSSPSTLEHRSGAQWFVVPDDYEQPITHIVLMIVLVISAVVGTIATSFWIWKSRSADSKTGTTKSGGTSDDSTSSPRASPDSTSFTNQDANVNINRSSRVSHHRDHQSLTVPEMINDYEDIEKNPNDPKSLNPRVESFA